MGGDSELQAEEQRIHFDLLSAPGQRGHHQLHPGYHGPLQTFSNG